MQPIEWILSALFIAWSLTFVGDAIINLYFQFLIRREEWLREVRRRRD